VLWYTYKASIESLWTVDSWNTNFRPWQIQESATGALKFNRTSGSKQHNINFHVFFDYAPGITCLLSSYIVLWYTNKASVESLWTVDSKNTNFRPWQIQVSDTRALKFNRSSDSKQHNINFHVFFDYAPGITWLLSSQIVLWYTNKAPVESLWIVDSKNTIVRPW
jgi:hypothetical protein